MDQTRQLLKELTEAHGVSGYEVEVRALVRQYVEPLGEIEQDRIVELFDGHEVRVSTEIDYMHKLVLMKKGLIHDLLTGRVRVSLDEKRLS